MPLRSCLLSTVPSQKNSITQNGSIQKKNTRNRIEKHCLRNFNRDVLESIDACGHQKSLVAFESILGKWPLSRYSSLIESTPGNNKKQQNIDFIPALIAPKIPSEMDR